MLADIESAMDLLGKTEKEEADAARLEAEAWWKAKVDAAKFRDEVETTEKRANRWAGKEKEAEDAKNAKAEADRIDAERVAVEEERLRKARESAERAEQILERSRSARANADAARRTAVTAREEAEEAAIAVARGERERIASDAAQERALRAEAEADSLDKVAKAEEFMSPQARRAHEQAEQSKPTSARSDGHGAAGEGENGGGGDYDNIHDWWAQNREGAQPARREEEDGPQHQQLVSWAAPRSAAALAKLEEHRVMSEATPRVVRDADVAEGTLVGARAPQGAGAAIEGAGEDDGPFEANSELARFLAWWKTNNAETSAGATDAAARRAAHTLVEALKVKGDEAYRAGAFDAAVVEYSRCLALIAARRRDGYFALKVRNNRAAAYKQLTNHEATRDDCNAVLARWPHNVKARCRRAEALEALEAYDEALDDVRAVLDHHARAPHEVGDANARRCFSARDRLRRTLRKLEGGEGARLREARARRRELAELDANAKQATREEALRDAIAFQQGFEHTRVLVRGAGRWEGKLMEKHQRTRNGKLLRRKANGIDDDMRREAADAEESFKEHAATLIWLTGPDVALEDLRIDANRFERALCRDCPQLKVMLVSPKPGRRLCTEPLRWFSLKPREWRERYLIEPQARPLAPRDRLLRGQIDEACEQVRELVEREARLVGPRYVALAGFDQGGVIATHVGLNHLPYALGAIVAINGPTPLLPSLLEGLQERPVHDAQIWMMHGSNNAELPSGASQVRVARECASARQN